MAMTGELDAKQATAQLKKYFEDIHGSYSVLGFRVHAASKASDGKWTIVCSFSSGYNEPRLKYSAEIDARGQIENVAEVRDEQ